MLKAETLENLKATQLRNSLPPPKSLDSGDFTVEMETETGKSCVYLSTILELNKRYGFTKLVTVMPSVVFGPQFSDHVSHSRHHQRREVAGSVRGGDQR